MLDAAFDALKKLDWGTDLAAVAPIDDAVAATHGKADARQDLENRLVDVLKSDASRDAKDYTCRKLAIVGTAASVPALSTLVTAENHSHMARYALERIQAAEAAQALRDALAKVAGNLKVGVIGSLGSRKDTGAVGALGGLLADANAAIAQAAAHALGSIGNADAANALQQAAGSVKEAKAAVTDGLLTCAESLLALKQKAEALAIYKSLSGEGQPRLVRLAATRGILACGKQG